MNEEQNLPLGQVVARALQDEAFKERLIAEPNATLAAEGVAVPDGLRLKVVEDTESERHLVLPYTQDRLSEAQLEGVNGGLAQGAWKCYFTFNVKDL